MTQMTIIEQAARLIWPISHRDLSDTINLIAFTVNKDLTVVELKELEVRICNSVEQSSCK